MSYKMEHCHPLNEYNDLKGKALAVKAEHGRPFDDIHTVFLCLEDAPVDGYLRVMGSFHRECSICCDDVLGVLKKECIPARFKHQMSTIPVKDSDQSTAFYGYVMDEAGYHTAGTPLADIHDVEEYLTLQKDIQHEIRITDTDDCLLLKMVEGELIFPRSKIQQSTHVTMAQAI